MRHETRDQRSEVTGPRAGRILVSCLWSLVSCLSLVGCIHRSLTIRTEPPGASVYVNDALKGESPVTYDFEWYGWHRLSIRKDGYERLDETKLLRSPPYLWIPFDLAMELMPFSVRDQRMWSYTLTPAPELPTPVPPPLTTESTPEPTQESTDAPR